MPEVVKSICDVLSTIPGIETESTTEGLDAVFMVKQKMENKQMYHLILSDLTMPYDGYEIAHDIRQLEKTKKTQPTYKIYGLSSDAQNPIVELKSEDAVHSLRSPKEEEEADFGIRNGARKSSGDRMCEVNL